MSREAKVLIIVVTLLLAIGIVMLFSASAIYASETKKIADPYFFLKRQLQWLLISVAGLIIVANVPYTLWARVKYILLGITIVMLLLVLIPGIGTKINGARRWIMIGPLSIQPSEMAKITIAIFMSAFISTNYERMKDWLKGFLPSFGLLALICGMILLQPDMGTAMFIAIVMTTILIIGGIRVIHIVPAFCTGALIMCILALYKFPYIVDRVMTFKKPDADPLGKGYHINQSLIALGYGGLFGTGLGKGISKLFFLPEVESDFIFSVVGEELGFVGTICILGLFAYLLYIGWNICKKTTNKFAFLLSFSITAFIILQAIMNIAVVTASMPTKGIPLPFLSAGGSSLLFTMVGVGILINISNCSHKAATGKAKTTLIPAATPEIIKAP